MPRQKLHLQWYRASYIDGIYSRHSKSLFDLGMNSIYLGSITHILILRLKMYYLVLMQILNINSKIKEPFRFERIKCSYNHENYGYAKRSK